MESQALNVSGNSVSIGIGNYNAISLKLIAGDVSFHAGTHAHAIPLTKTLFTISGARGRALDISNFKLKGSGSAVVFKFTDTVLVPSVNIETYNAETNFNDGLARMFKDEFLTDQVTWGIYTLRAVIEDQQIILGDGATQYQTISKAATFILDDLPTGWTIGDTFTLNGITWNTTEVVEQDQYTVKFLISQNTR